MNNKNLDKLVKEALAIEHEEAFRAGAIGYMSRALIQATMPHSKTAGSEFKRQNGSFKLVILADSDIGLPYGSLPRLLLSWITTEAVKAKQRDLVLGKSLSNFMTELGLIPSGGRWGSIHRLKDQMKRLFSSSISCTYDDGKTWGIRNVTPVEKAELWWNSKTPKQSTIWNSTLQLGESFFNEIISNPTPIDIRALKALKQSPMAIDIYCWLTYRMSYLRKITHIPWAALQMQFGANYKDLRQFKRRFNDQLKKVLILYPDAKIRETQESLMLLPSKAHIQKQTKLIVNNNCYATTTKDNNQQESSKKEQKKIDKLRDKKYEEYKLNAVMEIIENIPDVSEKHALLKEFDNYLYRKRLFKTRSQIIKGIHDKEVKKELYRFTDNYWHHLVEPIKSYKDFFDEN